MNVTELARQVRLPTAKLREILPQIGFDIGVKAIKVDDKTAQKIIKELARPSIRERFLKEKVAENNEQVQKNELEKDENQQTNTNKRIISIGETILVKDLAKELNLPVTKLILELMKNGVMASLNQSIDFETASIMAGDFGFEVLQNKNSGSLDWEKEKEQRKKMLADEQKNLKPRPPVIVVMGHVDHGKTKLLDAIRETNVVDAESGGITQHIGAYQVEKKGQPLTFIDTPGHEAFSAMRSRGAQVADIAILIVAADDGVQPQTIEALSHARSAGLPLVVAINKIDKEQANIDKIKSELAEIGLTVEDWGGQTVAVEISAKQKINIDKLLETLLLVYEMEKENIQGNADRGAVGTIIEAHIDKGLGPVATCLVQTGKLDIGDTIKIGNVVSRVRVLKNWKGEKMKYALPSTPAQIIGLKNVPQVGEILTEITDKKEIKKLNKLSDKQNYKLLNKKANSQSIKKDDEEHKDTKKINIILKTDVFGSIEAINESIEKIKSDEVEIDIVKQSLGNINEGDVEQAADLKAMVIGFHVKTNPAAEKLAIDKKVEIKNFEIIYNLLDTLQIEMKKMVKPKKVLVEMGKIKILKIFKKSANKQIVGGRVLGGRIENEKMVRVLRNENKVAEGKIKGLQCSKENVKETVEGQECGLEIETNDELLEGDILEIYDIQEK